MAEKRNYMVTRPFQDTVVLVMNERTARLLLSAVRLPTEPNIYDRNLLLCLSNELNDVLPRAASSGVERKSK